MNSRKGPKKGDISKILESSDESWYWLGFILADGSFVGDRVKLTLGKDEKKQEELFCNFLNKEYKGSSSPAFMCKETIPKIKQILGIVNTPKTYNSPDLKSYDNISDRDFESLMIGFIDGDGYIRRQSGRATSIVSIKEHSSWVDFLDYSVRRLHTISNFKFKGKAIVGNDGYARVNFGNFKLLKHLKNITVDRNLPVLKRKLEVIDESLDTEDETFALFKTKVKMLVNKGFTYHETAFILDSEYEKVCRTFNLEGV